MQYDNVEAKKSKKNIRQAVSGCRMFFLLFFVQYLSRYQDNLFFERRTFS